MSLFEAVKPQSTNIRDFVTTAFNKSLNSQTGYFEKFVKWYQLYRGVQSDRSYRGRADLFIPEPYTNIESVHARVIRSFGGLKANPQGPEDLKGARFVENLLDWQTRVYNFKQSFKDADKDRHIYGTSILKTGWKFDEHSDHPTIEVVDPAHYFFDPETTSQQNARYEIHRSYATIKGLRSNPNYDQKEIDKLERTIGKNRSRKSAISDDSFENRRKTATGVGKPYTRDGQIEVLEYWGLYKGKGDKEEKEYLIVLADRNHILRKEENPFSNLFPEVEDENLARPFVIMKDTDVPHEYYGVGMIEPCEKLFQELNDTRNQRMDNVTLIVDPMYEVLEAADIDHNQLVSRAGGIVESAVPNGVRAIPRGDVTQSAYAEEQIIKQDIQKTLGIPDVASGSLGNAQGEAAATILSLQESANIRFDVQISSFADAVRQCYHRILTYNQQWLDKKVTTRLDTENGPEFNKIDKKSIAGKFDLDVQMDTQMNKIVRRQEAFQLYQLLASNPLVNQQTNTRVLLETLDRPEIEELLDVPPPAPAPPQEPKKSISVSLKGDLNSLESDDLAVVMGAKQESADPLLREETRELMQGGNKDKQQEDMIKKLEVREKLLEEKRLNRSLDLKEREIVLKEKQAVVETAEKVRDVS